MKTTVKTDIGRVTVQPLPASGRVLLSMGMPGAFPGLELTPDQAGALILGMEMALETIDQRHKQALETMRAAAWRELGASVAAAIFVATVSIGITAAWVLR